MSSQPMTERSPSTVNYSTEQVTGGYAPTLTIVYHHAAQATGGIVDRHGGQPSRYEELHVLVNWAGMQRPGAHQYGGCRVFP